MMCCRLFLAKSCGTLVLELLVESVAVTDSGDVVAFEESVSSRKFRSTRCAAMIEGLLSTYRTTSRNQRSHQDLQLTVSQAPPHGAHTLQSFCKATESSGNAQRAVDAPMATERSSTT